MKALFIEAYRAIHKRSHDPADELNRTDADWIAGRILGMFSNQPSFKDLEEHFEEIGRKQTKRWQSWKAGYWAGRFDRL